MYSIILFMLNNNINKDIYILNIKIRFYTLGDIKIINMI